MSNSEFKQEGPVEFQTQDSKAEKQERTLAMQFFACLVYARSIWARFDLISKGMDPNKVKDKAEGEALKQCVDDFNVSVSYFDQCTMEVFAAVASLPPDQDQSLGVTETLALREWRAAFKQFRRVSRALIEAAPRITPKLLTQAPPGSVIHKIWLHELGAVIYSFKCELEALELKLRVAAPGLLIEVAPGGAA